MSADSIILDKSLKFAARIVRLYQYLVKNKKETIISKQIIRSGTSIGANANEAIYGVSKADFIAKLQISLKETAETEYWLRLLISSEYVTEQEGNSLLNDCLEIKRILISTLNTAKKQKDILLECGAELCMMSGSGPAVFAFFKDKASANAAASAVRKTGARAFVCETV